MVDRTEPVPAAAPAAPLTGDDDPRVILAAERTLLAWIRTGLAMMGFGFLVAKFGLFLEEIAALRGGASGYSSRWSVWIGTAMVVLGVLVNLAAGIEHLQYERTIARKRRLPGWGYRLGIASALFLVVVGAFMVVRLLLL